jgi:hypothetical protein
MVGPGCRVESLFGNMVDSPGFYQSLLRNIGRKTAFCVRQDDGPPGALLVGGLLFSPRPPDHLTSNLGRDDALLEQLGCPQTPFLHRCEVTPRSNAVINQPARQLLLYQNMIHLRVSREPPVRR